MLVYDGDVVITSRALVSLKLGMLVYDGDVVITNRALVSLKGGLLWYEWYDWPCSSLGEPATLLNWTSVCKQFLHLFLVLAEHLFLIGLRSSLWSMGEPRRFGSDTCFVAWENCHRNVLLANEVYPKVTIISKWCLVSLKWNYIVVWHFYFDSNLPWHVTYYHLRMRSILTEKGLVGCSIWLIGWCISL